MAISGIFYYHPARRYQQWIVSILLLPKTVPRTALLNVFVLRDLSGITTLNCVFYPVHKLKIPMDWIKDLKHVSAIMAIGGTLKSLCAYWTVQFPIRLVLFKLRTHANVWTIINGVASVYLAMSTVTTFSMQPARIPILRPANVWLLSIGVVVPAH